MHLEFNDIKDPIQYCKDIILREAKEEDRLVSLILFTILSANTKNPINLAINAPSGEGKSHVVLKVAEIFPQNELIFF